MPHFLDQPKALLGQISPNNFMQEYWQKKPLFISKAFANYTSPVTLETLISLARLDTTESRLVQQSAKGWELKHGPFKRLPATSKPNWTLLVQGVNTLEPQIADLLDLFRFIPNIRLDDVMISYATLGGGVGPHFDSYDVFLLQAQGTREWSIGPLKDFSLQPDVPVKLLQNFTPAEKRVLQPGDMLYLPPRWGHDGIALSSDCITISIGFRTPIAHELQIAGLEFAAQELAQQIMSSTLPEMYTDPEQTATDTPGEIPHALIDYTHELLQKIRWDKAFAAKLLGSWFSEPKAHLFFTPPDEVPALIDLKAPCKVLLDSASVLLYTTGCQFFLNGECYENLKHPIFTALANQRKITIPQPDTYFASMTAVELDTLQMWLEDGWIHLQT